MKYLATFLIAAPIAFGIFKMIDAISNGKYLDVAMAIGTAVGLFLVFSLIYGVPYALHKNLRSPRLPKN